MVVPLAAGIGCAACYRLRCLGRMRFSSAGWHAALCIALPRRAARLGRVADAAMAAASRHDESNHVVALTQRLFVPVGERA